MEIDGNPDQATVIKWDLSAIPAGSVVDSVTITINVVNTSSDTFELYQVLRPWEEHEATYIQASNGNNWEGPGATGDASLQHLELTDPGAIALLAQAGMALQDSIWKGSSWRLSITKLVAESPEGFEVYSGDDWATFGYLCLGAVGVVSVASHLVGPQIRQMIELIRRHCEVVHLDSPIDYRAGFEKQAGGWRIVFFLAGD